MGDFFKAAIAIFLGAVVVFIIGSAVFFAIKGVVDTFRNTDSEYLHQLCQGEDYEIKEQNETYTLYCMKEAE